MAWPQARNRQPPRDARWNPPSVARATPQDTFDCLTGKVATANSRRHAALRIPSSALASLLSRHRGIRRSASGRASSTPNSAGRSPIQRPLRSTARPPGAFHDARRSSGSTTRRSAWSCDRNADRLAIHDVGSVHAAGQIGTVGRHAQLVEASKSSLTWPDPRSCLLPSRSSLAAFYAALRRRSSHGRSAIGPSRDRMTTAPESRGLSGAVRSAAPSEQPVAATALLGNSNIR